MVDYLINMHRLYLPLNLASALLIQSRGSIFIHIGAYYLGRYRTETVNQTDCYANYAWIPTIIKHWRSLAIAKLLFKFHYHQTISKDGIGRKLSTNKIAAYWWVIHALQQSIATANSNIQKSIRSQYPQIHMSAKSLKVAHFFSMINLVNNSCQ